ncbi:MAG: diaminopimelate epimerase [Bdellovibrionales bacterium GWB1_55_8]|nr:MAG: diaminopimelate epimerase [Bdellovibrionales bacterium GWB1_55_8]
MGMSLEPGFPFIKMHGLGNDFIVFDDFVEAELDTPASTPMTADLAKAVCDRRFGIGADQVLWLRKPHDDAADVRMEIRNADGSVAEMCGNGVRAVGILLARKYPSRAEFVVETLAGMKKLMAAGNGFQVSMGVPTVSSPSHAGETLTLRDGAQLPFLAVNVGNPHAVLFVPDLEGYPVEKFGPIIECHPRFPGRTNVEFVEVRVRSNGSSSLRMRVWERGAGVTLACGTGACAAAVAARVTGKVQSDKVELVLDGGTLYTSWAGEGTPVVLEGPATETYRGTWPRTAS